MKLKALFIAGAVAAAAVPTVSALAASGGTTRDSVTGGGQAFFDARDPSGPGDTVAFQAQRAKGAPDGSDLAVGQIQVNRRGAANAVKFHGTITCLVTNGVPKSGAGNAYMRGMSRASKTTQAQPFELYVSDGGKGQQERDDMIMLYVGNETTQNDSSDPNAADVCGFSDFNPDTDATDLFRGNVQVRNRNTSEDATPGSSTAKAAALRLSLVR
jgi:hypothetical protein